MKIDECRNLAQIKAVMKEQGITIRYGELVGCDTIKDIIMYCKSWGAK